MILLAAPLLVALATGACTESGTAPPATPETIEISRGNHQSGTVGQPLTTPLEVVVRSSSGGGVANITVAWEVTAGDGSVTPFEAATDGSGTATATWTLGTTAGLGQAVRAEVAGLGAVTFSAAALPGPASSITVVSGDGQTATPGAELSEPVVVRVLDEFDNPVPEVTVTFQPSDGGQATPPSAPTSSLGQAQTIWTLAVQPGEQSLTMLIATGALVTATADAVDPCDVAVPYTPGTDVDGELAPGDCEITIGGIPVYVDLYGFELEAGAGLRFVQAGTPPFDPLLILLGPAGIVAYNDDAHALTLNSAFNAILPAGGFVLVATTFEAEGTGAYTLSSTVEDPVVTDCEFWWVTFGSDAAQEFQTSDCVFESAADPSVFWYADIYPVYLRDGETVTVTQRSTDVDSFLELRTENLQSVLVDDLDSAGGNDARITYTAPALGEGIYHVVASTWNPEETGAYSLEVTGSAPVTAQSAVPSLPGGEARSKWTLAPSAPAVLESLDSSRPERRLRPRHR